MGSITIQTGMLLRAKQFDEDIKTVRFLKHYLPFIIYYTVSNYGHITDVFSRSTYVPQYGLIILCFVIKLLILLKLHL